MEPVRNEFENYDTELEERRKICNEHELAKIEALRAEVAEKKELLRKRKQACLEKEDQLKVMQQERKQAKEKQDSEKRILEQKLKEIREKNELLRKRKQGQEEERQKAKDEKAERKKKKEAPPEDTSPVITEEMQAEYEAQISELKEKVEMTRRNISEIEFRQNEIQREIRTALEYGKDLSDHKEQLVNQIAELEKKLIENTQEQNRLLKEKEEFEEKLKLNKMADHCEKGNSMVAEIEDGNQIMIRNLKIVNQKCIEIKKKIALKSFELGKLRESHANLLYDLKKKNNNCKSAYGVVQGEIDEFKKKIEDLERKMEALLQIEGTIQLPSGDDSMKYLKTMFTSKMKSVRDAVLECHEVSKQTFVKREAVFQLEYEFRNLKSDLRESQNQVGRKRDDLKTAIEESERKSDAVVEELNLETLPQNSHAILQPTSHPHPTRNPSEGIPLIEENPTVNVRDSEEIHKDVSSEETKGEYQHLNEVNEPAENIMDQNEPLDGRTEFTSQNELSEFQEEQKHQNNSLDSKNLVESGHSQSLEEQNSSHELVTPNISSNNEDLSSDQLNTSSFTDEDCLVGKFKNVNNSLALGKVSSGLNESSFIDEEGLATKFKNINSSLIRGNNVVGSGRTSNSRNLLHDFTNTSSSIDEEDLASMFRNVNSSLVNRGSATQAGQRVPNSRNLLHDFTNTSSSFDESLGNKIRNGSSSIGQDNLASELMFADKENSDLIRF